MVQSYCSVSSLLCLSGSSWAGNISQQQRFCFISAIKSVKTFDLFVYSWEPEVLFHQCFCRLIQCLCLHWHFYNTNMSSVAIGFREGACGVLWSCGISAVYPVNVSKIVTHIFVLLWFCCNSMTKTSFFVWHFDWQSLFWRITFVFACILQISLPWCTSKPLNLVSQYCCTHNLGIPIF